MSFMSSESIAIIVPVFNVERYIGKTIQSIINQSVKPDEVIIIDDGSCDKSLKYLLEVKNVNNFKIYETRNNGLGSARNLGRYLAKSNYIYFLDSDDFLKRDFVKIIKYNIIKNNFPDIILFSGHSFGDRVSNLKMPKYHRSLAGVYKDGISLLVDQIKSNELYSSACLYVSKSEIWSKNRLAFPSIIHEDECIYYQLISFCVNLVVINEILFMRRVRIGSIMTSEVDYRYSAGMLKISHELIEFIDSNQKIYTLNKKIWRNRVGQFISNYVLINKRLNKKIHWPAVIGGILTAKHPYYIILIAINIAPIKFRNFIKDCYSKFRTCFKK